MFFFQLDDQLTGIFGLGALLSFIAATATDKQERKLYPTAVPKNRRKTCTCLKPILFKNLPGKGVFSKTYTENLEFKKIKYFRIKKIERKS